MKVYQRSALAPTILALMLGAGTATADIIAYEGFDYTDDDATIGGRDGGTGWNGAWTDGGGGSNQNLIVDGASSLTFGGLQTSGRATTAESSSSSSDRNLASAITGGTFWMSVLISNPDVNNNFSVVRLDGSGTSINFGIGGGSFPNWSLNNGAQDTGIAASNNTAALLVLEATLAAGNDTFNLYINPTIGGSAPTIADATETGVDLGNFTDLRIVSAFSTFDELRIGETFADVTPIPEPSAFALIAGSLALLAMMTQRRR